MNNKNLLKIANISGWALVIILLLYFISGYSMVHKYGMDILMNKPQALFWHKYLTIPFLMTLLFHIVPYYIVRKNITRLLVLLSIIIAIPVISVYSINKFQKPEQNKARHKDKISEWYYPQWASEAKYNTPIKVLDTQSPLGRYSTKTKELSLKDMALIHGHLCDGLVISYVEIKAVFEKLFPNGIIDRTDIRVVSKNGPCWVDAASMMTGARINFGTLSIQPEIGDGFIIQKISTGEAYDVHLKKGIFPENLAKLENKIRTAKKQGGTVSPKDIAKVENMQKALSKKLLNTPLKDSLDIKALPKYNYVFNFSTTKRGDVINKNISQ